MKSKGKKYTLVFSGVILIVLFISIITWNSPYSTFSINKSYAYKHTDTLHNGKSYSEMLNDFKTSYEKELKAEEERNAPDLTILRTQYILPKFEQDWLINEDPVSFDNKKLEVLLSDVKFVREHLLTLLAQADYDKEERDYLISVIRYALSIEESINELKDVNFETKRVIKIRFRNLEDTYASLFSRYESFYERVTTD